VISFFGQRKPVCILVSNVFTPIKQEIRLNYTKTDAGALVGNTKAVRIIILKELGKFTL